MSTPYAELHCLSHFSFQRGASSPEELAERAAALGYTALAITDECSLAGVVRAHVALRALPDPKPALIIGSEIRLADGPKLVLLACNRNGYGNLAELITRGRMAADKGRYHLTLADLDAGLADCIALLAPTDDDIADAATLAAHGCWLRSRFGERAWLAVELHLGTDDCAKLAALQAAADASGLPLCAAGDVHMHVRQRRRLQDTLTAIRLHRTLPECGERLFPNGERHLRLPHRLAQIHPAEQLAASVHIAAQCSFSLDELRYEYPEEIVPAGHTPASWLRHLAERGYVERCGQIRRVVRLDDATFELKAGKLRQQIEDELALIAELKYEPYFLTVYDIVAWARSRGILCQGRGSAANSAVCYCIGVTEVDPWRANMLFGRFISRERNEAPDIDVDFEHERREEVIQYIYGKYGRDRAALAASLTCYRPRSALRDVGRALGFSDDALDRLTRGHMWWDGRQVREDRMAEAGFSPASPHVRRLMELANELIGAPRHLSQHVGGFVIARGRLSRLVPIENARMPDRCVIQWDKDDLEAVGLMKVDVLALGMLTAIRKTLQSLATYADAHPASPATGPGPMPRSVADIPPEDPATYDMLCRGESTGVFQVESRAQMNMLPRLRPRRYYDLVIQVAIVRPGPIQGGMVHPYLARRHLPPERIDYPSDELRPVLERTLGVPIFQEQVMQLAVVAAGFTPGEADQMRRSMAAWRQRGTMEKFQHKLTAGLLNKGYTPEFAEQIYRQIEGFSGYGFPESHAASFALLVYTSSWLKCHHPAAFLCGLLNSQPMGFYAPAQLIADARAHGVDVHPADVTVSGWDCVLERPSSSRASGPAVRLGLRMIKGVSQDAMQSLIAARAKAPFANVDDLARRARLDRQQLRCLAAGGALQPLAGNRHQAHWQAAVRRPDALLGDAPVNETPLALAAPHEGEDIVADYASLGFTLGRHPLALLRGELAAQRFITAAELRRLPDRALARAAGIVTCRQRPGTASGVMFVTVEDETGLANVIVHKDVQEKQRHEVLGATLLGIYGQVSREGEVIHLIARRLVDRSALLGALTPRSRDFH
ncbi:MAG: error-prone DNA polymerase [Methyloversatilis discipulorum]|uniref:error-prone DNA polymerase n=1 Tax=Methyloversatilis discipulorum TaxID=1119528 RepID=UPI0026F31A49|nr:error-prone DNA polymerase [Methyloversatilis discipulorum]MBT9518334.1 error-prone DNA polymerase [Methyloversatilis discipulorum]